MPQNSFGADHSLHEIGSINDTEQGRLDLPTVKLMAANKVGWANELVSQCGTHDYCDRL